MKAEEEAKDLVAEKVLYYLDTPCLVDTHIKPQAIKICLL